ncbi:MAG: hypothetical protein LBR17_02935 [Bacteroidales bacterium]|jgi:hypothetical protein|nr:hypothetical protein [Bacteroidales bacterium]
MKCNKCNFENTGGSQFCGNCGASLPQIKPKKKKGRGWLWVVLILVLLVLGIIIFMITTQGQGGSSYNNSWNNNDSNYEYSENNDNRSSKRSISIEEKIKIDLVGQAILEPTHEKFRSSFNVSSQDEVTSVSIYGTENISNGTKYYAKLKLQGNANEYVADVVLTYIENNGEKTLQNIESKGLDIVPTGNYKDCITIKAESCGLFIQCLYAYNNCSVALVIEGKYWDKYKKEWVHYAVEVPSNGNAMFPTNYKSTDTDYKIERIERP